MVRLALAPRLDDGSPVPPTALTHTGADLTDEQLSDEIAEADSEIDGYLAGRYVTPVAVVDVNNPDSLPPNPISYWSRNIAAYKATLTYKRNQPVETTNPVYLRYQMTMQALLAASNGSMILDIPSDSGDVTTVTSGGAVNVQPGVGLCDGLELGGAAWPNTRPFEFGWGTW